MKLGTDCKIEDFKCQILMGSGWKANIDKVKIKYLAYLSEIKKFLSSKELKLFYLLMPFSHLVNVNFAFAQRDIKNL